MYKEFKENIGGLPLQKILPLLRLRNFLSLGVFFYLTGMFYFTSWSGYKAAMYVFLFLPGLVLLAMDRKFRLLLKNSREFMLFTLLTFYGVISVFWSANAGNIAELKWPLYIFLFGVGVLACEYSQPGNLKKLMTLGVFVAGASAAYALYHCYVKGQVPYTGRLVGYGLLEHPILASFVYTVFLVGGLVIYTGNRFGRWTHLLFITSLLLLLLYLFATQTRGAIVAFVAYLLFACVVQRDRFAIGYAVAFVLCLAGILYFSYGSLVERGFSYRPELWWSGIRIALQEPWLGFGVSSEYGVPVADGAVHDHPHNMYIRLFMDLGIVGVVLWFSLLTMLFYKLLKSTRPERFLALGLLVYASVAILFDGDGPFVRPKTVWFVSWLPLMFAIAWLAVPAPSQQNKPGFFKAQKPT